jgi:hypothetical protein
MVGGIAVLVVRGVFVRGLAQFLWEQLVRGIRKGQSDLLYFYEFCGSHCGFWHHHGLVHGVLKLIPLETGH